MTFNLFSQTKEIIGYFPEWGIKYKPYYVKDIITSGSAEKLTAINYAFGIPTPDENGDIKISFEYPEYAYAEVHTAEQSVDGIADNPNQPLRGHFNQLRKLKKQYPHLKIIVSLGGWLGSIYFSKAALTEKSRNIFVDACIDLFIRGDLPQLNGAGGKGAAKSIFDGIDIDWEYPVEGGTAGIFHDPNDGANLTKLFKLFRKKLDTINPNYLLTAALPANHSSLNHFQIVEDVKYLNWFMIMNYDYYGGWDPITGHHTNLFKSSYEPKSNGKNRSQHVTVKRFIEEFKIPSNKVIPGVAFYGRGWKNVEPIKNGLFQSGTVAEGKNEPGYNYYSDLKGLVDQGFELHWDDTALAPWLYNKSNKILWTLDTPYSIKLKTEYAQSHSLGGVMFWDLSGDDEKGTLIKSIHENLENVRRTNNLVRTSNDVSIELPQNGAKYSASENVIISAKFNTKSIIMTELFVDGISYGKLSNKPFQWVLFNVKPGNYELIIAAKDQNGNGSYSEKKTIIVE